MVFANFRLIIFEFWTSLAFWCPSSLGLKSIVVESCIANLDRNYLFKTNANTTFKTFGPCFNLDETIANCGMLVLPVFPVGVWVFVDLMKFVTFLANFYYYLQFSVKVKDIHQNLLFQQVSYLWIVFYHFLGEDIYNFKQQPWDTFAVFD